MKYGLVGESLKHSFSPEIHSKIADYEYGLFEVPRDKIDDFFERRDFAAVNVTIPYKETVIPHLNEIDEGAAKIGAVNTVVNRGGRLFGYNTDFWGMLALIGKCGVSLKGRHVLILGTGGTSKTAASVCEHLGAGRITRLGRREGIGDGLICDAEEKFSSAEFIINTTPVGMFPNIFGLPVNPKAFPKLLGAIDAVYNPQRTPLVLAVRALGLPAFGGLYMLVGQAVFAADIFLDRKNDASLLDRVYSEIAREKENIVLIGMPSSGKSTVGAALAERMGRKFIDTDEVIREISKKEIPEIFSEVGERGFRDIESEAIRQVAGLSGYIIATGGGAVLREENVSALKENGRIFFLDRPLSHLMPTHDRPLSSDREALARRFAERYPIYSTVCDEKIDASSDVCDVTEEIINRFCK